MFTKSRDLDCSGIVSLNNTPFGTGWSWLIPFSPCKCLFPRLGVKVNVVTPAVCHGLCRSLPFGLFGINGAWTSVSIAAFTVVPLQRVGGVRLIAELVQQRGASLQYDHVVNDHGHQHHHHLQLVVDPEEHWAGHQAEDAAVDQVLEGKDKQPFCSLVQGHAGLILLALFASSHWCDSKCGQSGS